MNFGFLKPADESFPPIVHVETTNICNLRCIHCPHSDVHAAIPGYAAKTIDMALWKRVVDEVAQHNAALRITPDTRPLSGRQCASVRAIAHSPLICRARQGIGEASRVRPSSPTTRMACRATAVDPTHRELKEWLSAWWAFRSLWAQ